MIASRVVFEFKDRATAERFSDAITEWLCCYVTADAERLRSVGLDPDNLPHGASEFRLRENRAWSVPRYWLYGDASPSIEPVPGSLPARRGCNLHEDCSVAGEGARHCHVEDCEDCFGC